MIPAKFCIGLFTVAACVTGLAGTVAATRAPAPFAVLALSTNDRVLVMAPHPDDESISVSVPLSVLGNPDRILISAQTSRAEVPFDWVAWRILVLPLNRAPPGAGQ